MLHAASRHAHFDSSHLGTLVLRDDRSIRLVGVLGIGVYHILSGLNGSNELATASHSYAVVVHASIHGSTSAFRAAS